MASIIIGWMSISTEIFTRSSILSPDVEMRSLVHPPDSYIYIFFRKNLDSHQDPTACLANVIAVG